MSTKITRNLPNNAYEAAVNADNPSVINPYATVNELPAPSSGNQLISGGASYSGTGLGAYDSWMHENGEHQDDWFITQAQILHAGNLAVTEAGGAEEYYWEIYHLMGDPSLMPYVGIPTTINVSHNSIIPTGATTFVVNSEENS